MPEVPAAAPDRPAVSIVMATFNRSNVIPHAIASVRAQTLVDWELLVVGDACTDDTERAVAAFEDPRIRFVNLERNLGDQSGPNSIGMRLARAPRIAWLNHDDLWFPDHLERLSRLMDESGADVAIAPAYRVRELASDPSGWSGVVEATPLAEGFDLVGGSDFQASRWLMDAGLVRRLGDWRSARRLRYVASQEYLYRAWSAGARFALSPVRSVVLVPSIVGGGSYLTRRDDEQRLLRERVLAGDRAPLEALAVPIVPRVPPLAISVPDATPSRARAWLRRNAAELYHRTHLFAVRLGAAPWEYAAFLLGVPRGGTNRLLRQRRGLV